jgi:hypothetical protein
MILLTTLLRRVRYHKKGRLCFWVWIFTCGIACCIVHTLERIPNSLAGSNQINKYE